MAQVNHQPGGFGGREDGQAGAAEAQQPAQRGGEVVRIGGCGAAGQDLDSVDDRVEPDDPEEGLRGPAHADARVQPTA
eukprot:13941696-Alexandrium_andersonii.AAC.1